MTPGLKCKCGALTIEAHTKRVAAGYPGHIYSGPYWSKRTGS